jgi:excisionase family DNA binding protein
MEPTNSSHGLTGAADVRALLTAPAAAKWLGLNAYTVKKYFREGRIGAVFMGGRWLTSRAAILKFLEPVLNGPTK